MVKLGLNGGGEQYPMELMGAYTRKCFQSPWGNHEAQYRYEGPCGQWVLRFDHAFL